jgi:hypothetical protein
MKKVILIVAMLSAAMMIFGMSVMSVNASVVPGVYTNPVPPGYGFINFESGTDGAVIHSTIPGLVFTTTAGYDWVYGDARTGAYNIQSLTDPSVNYGNYVCNGYFFAWLGPSAGEGRIDFVLGPASYFSVLVSCNTNFVVEAYNSSGDLITTSGVAASNYGTFTFTQCTVQTPTPQIAYVLCHDSGNYWCIDDLVTDAPGVPTQVIPEVPFGTILASASMVIGLLAYVAVPRFVRTRKPANL